MDVDTVLVTSKTVMITAAPGREADPKGTISYKTEGGISVRLWGGRGSLRGDGSRGGWLEIEKIIL